MTKKENKKNNKSGYVVYILGFVIIFVLGFLFVRLLHKPKQEEDPMKEWDLRFNYIAYNMLEIATDDELLGKDIASGKGGKLLASNYAKGYNRVAPYFRTSNITIPVKEDIVSSLYFSAYRESMPLYIDITDRELIDEDHYRYYFNTKIRLVDYAGQAGDFYFPGFDVYYADYEFSGLYLDIYKENDMWRASLADEIINKLGYFVVFWDGDREIKVPSVYVSTEPMVLLEDPEVNVYTVNGKMEEIPEDYIVTDLLLDLKEAKKQRQETQEIFGVKPCPED